MNNRELFLGEELTISATPTSERKGRVSLPLAIISLSALWIGGKAVNNFDASIPFVSSPVYAPTGEEHTILADTYRADNDGEIATTRDIDHAYTRALPFDAQQIIPLEDLEDPAEIAEDIATATEEMASEFPDPLIIDTMLFDPDSTEFVHDTNSNPDAAINDPSATNIAAYSVSSARSINTPEISTEVSRQLASVSQQLEAQGEEISINPLADGTTMIVPYSFEQFATAIDIAQKQGLNNVSSMQQRSNIDPELKEFINNPATGIVDEALGGPALIVTASIDPSASEAGNEPPIGPICVVQGASETNLYKVVERHEKVNNLKLMLINALLSPFAFAHISRRRRREIDGKLAPSTQDIEALQANTATTEQKMGLYLYRQALSRTDSNEVRQITASNRKTLVTRVAGAMLLTTTVLGALTAYEAVTAEGSSKAPAPLSAQLPEPAKVSREACEATDLAVTRYGEGEKQDVEIFNKEGKAIYDNTFTVTADELPPVAIFASPK